MELEAKRISLRRRRYFLSEEDKIKIRKGGKMEATYAYQRARSYANKMAQRGYELFIDKHERGVPVSIWGYLVNTNSECYATA